MFRNYVNLVKNLSIIHVTGTQNVFFARTLTFFTRVPLNQYNQNLQTLHKNSIESFRHKSKFPKKQQSQETTTDSYDSDEDKDEIKDKYSKVLTINVTSMRVDAILKTALGMSRNKIETEFYENKIRINGTKVAKKSAEVYAELKYCL
ncbi:hypothetical protein ABEB36_009102 [Hypothenemus hampei]|uniref:Mitochondrial transcription rescue factor 1 C-terminal domain-containing protein n=1 Tax=Hypothenemus hampei TaxID=57062 RepID=A0ABD1EP59_HYPHA